MPQGYLFDGESKPVPHRNQQRPVIRLQSLSNRHQRETCRDKLAIQYVGDGDL